jgi:arginine exporter protein ArgO
MHWHLQKPLKFSCRLNRALWERPLWHFASGRSNGEIGRFAALGFGERLLQHGFTRPASWLILDGVLSIVMLILAAALGLGALQQAK